MPRQKKSDEVTKMRQDLARAAGVIFVDFTGLTVSEVDGLRRRCREAEVGYQVVKNTLMARAVADAPYADVASCLKGTPTGVVWGWVDPVAPAKLAYAFAKDCGHVRVKGGIVEQKGIGAQEAEALSKSLSRAELQAMVVAQAQGPGRRVAGFIAGPAGRIVGAIDAFVVRHEGAEQAPA